MDQYVNISDPFLRDWAIIISAAFIGLFVFLKWVLGYISSQREATDAKRNIEASRVETYLKDELTRNREELRELTQKYHEMNNNTILIKKDFDKLRTHVRRLSARNVYLESLLLSNGISFAPFMEANDYD